MSIPHAILSDVGSVRDNNEDHASVCLERNLFIVADGMGGHVAGEVASRVAAESFMEYVLGRAKPRRVRDALSTLRDAALAANDAVYRTAQAERLMGMGTTLTALMVHGRTACIAHVGDSRAYLVGKQLRVLTSDHTLTHLMVQSGILSETEALFHPERHVLTQAVGTARSVEPDVFHTRIPRGSRLLLSSDGLHDVVPPEELRSEASTQDLDKGARGLIQAAKVHGAPDNVTVILVEP